MGKMTCYIQAMLNSPELNKWWMFRYGTLDAFLEQLCKPIKIYGASNGGIMVKNMLDQYGVKVDCFIDSNNDKHYGELFGLPIFSPNHLLKGDVIAIASMYQNDIVRGLDNIDNYIVIPYDDFQNDIKMFNKRFVESNIDYFEWLSSKLSDKDSLDILEFLSCYYLTRDVTSVNISSYGQYSHPIVSAEPGDIVFDVGAYDGDSLIIFMDDANRNCKVYAFEPSKPNTEKIEKLIDTQKWQASVEVVNKAVGETTGKTNLQLDDHSPQNNITGDVHGIPVDQVSIDDFVDSNGVIPSLIKIDVEGYDEKVVRGALRTIRKYKPKLQIAIYHHPDHFIRVPKLILEANPSYQFYLGHHQGGCWDTVLYAKV